MNSYRLSHEEQEELQYQLEMNGQSYLSWDTVLRKVHPTRTYQTSTGYRKDVLTGEELLRRGHFDARYLNCSFMKTVTEVPADFQQPAEEYWERHVDPDTGKTMVRFAGLDVWSTAWLTQPPCPNPHPEYELDLDLITEMVIRKHWPSPEPDRKAIARARPSVNAAINRGYTSEMADGRNQEVALGVAMSRATMVFDVAYHRARIENAGIDLDQHTQFRDYQTFFDLGMRPPTHKEMADKTIELAGARPAEPQDRRD